MISTKPKSYPGDKDKIIHFNISGTFNPDNKSKLDTFIVNGTDLMSTDLFKDQAENKNMKSINETDTLKNTLIHMAHAAIAADKENAADAVADALLFANSNDANSNDDKSIDDKSIDKNNQISVLKLNRSSRLYPDSDLESMHSNGGTYNLKHPNNKVFNSKSQTKKRRTRNVRYIKPRRTNKKITS